MTGLLCQTDRDRCRSNGEEVGNWLSPTVRASVTMDQHEAYRVSTFCRLPPGMPAAVPRCARRRARGRDSLSSPPHRSLQRRRHGHGGRRQRAPGSVGPGGSSVRGWWKAPQSPQSPSSHEGDWGDGNLWRCGESNPGPTVVQQDFSGCSSCLVFSAPASPTNKNADGLSHLGVPRSPMTKDPGSGSLDDARNRGGSAPRADGLRSSLRRRGRSRCECYRHLLVRTER